jgi:uncharacterized repeat protein (TIGR02543 family)
MFQSPLGSAGPRNLFFIDHEVYIACADLELTESHMKRLLALTVLCMLLFSCQLSKISGISCSVRFDLNYVGATGEPPTQNIILGGVATAPAVPTRAGYSFGGWYSDPSCTDFWNFKTETVAADVVLFAQWIPNPAGTGYSVEVGVTDWGPDYATLSNLPSGGLVVSAWTRIPALYDWAVGDMSSPITVHGLPADLGNETYYKGNMNIFKLSALNWSLVLLDGNMKVSSAGASYNANSMVFDSANKWLGDYSYYQTVEPLIPVAEAVGWVWAAWYILPGTSSIKIVQWLKFGPGNAVFRSSMSASENASVSFTPGGYSSLKVGDARGYLYHVRVDSMSSEPTLAVLESIAQGARAASSAWADYAFEWKDGAAVIEDRSGHGRSLALGSINGSSAVFYQGPPIPVF